MSTLRFITNTVLALGSVALIATAPVEAAPTVIESISTLDTKETSNHSSLNPKADRLETLDATIANRDKSGFHTKHHIRNRRFGHRRFGRFSRRRFGHRRFRHHRLRHRDFGHHNFVHHKFSRY